MANPIAVPGTVVSSGAAVSPGGAQGVTGSQGPAGPTAVSTNANNKATLGTDSLLLVQGTAPGVAATTHAQTVSGDDPQLTTLASATTKGLLNQVSGNTTDFIDGTNNSQPLQPVIWSVRLRSWSSVGNSTFEVDQRNVGTALTNPASGTFIQDRWMIVKSALTGTVNTALQTGLLLLPGTNFNFAITNNYQRFTVSTSQAALAATDYYFLRQNIEGPRWRELSSDVHSSSLLVRSSVAGLAFCLSLQDNTSTHSLVKLCTISSANVWTLITLPNLPIWTGTFSAALGQIAYYLGITLACGTTYSAAASNAWQSANLLGITGMSNFLATAGATFDIAFIQHEPGPQCSTPIDSPFTQNLDDCLRYYFKTYRYGIAVGTSNDYAGANGSFYCTAAQVGDGYGSFAKTMAKIPTVVTYSPANGATGGAFRRSDATTITGVTAGGAGDRGFSTLSSTGILVNGTYLIHYTADTGW